MDEASEKKLAKYQGLLQDSWKQGRQAQCHYFEEDCSGFTGQSLHRVFILLCVREPIRSAAIKTATEAAKRAFRWVWIKRGDPWFNAAGMQVGI